MARKENATYKKIVTHLERELELNGLEEGDVIPVPTMSTAPPTTRPGQGLLSSGIDPGITSNYCKKPGHVKDDCRKLKRKEEQKVLKRRLKKSIQSARLVTEQTIRRNGVGKALEPTSSPKTLCWITPKLSK